MTRCCWRKGIAHLATPFLLAAALSVTFSASRSLGNGGSFLFVQDTTRAPARSLEEQAIARIKGMEMLSCNGENPGIEDRGQLDDVVPSKQLATKRLTCAQLLN